ncbi:MAG: ribbon-helix-helix protein, CopG family [Deltaproteobacteria bacterium]|nr:ribbon-helix-helix protein, CopG family [Deltaproteobacteria bacterium]
MRTTRVIAFSVPPEFEARIQKHARSEHRTISEYIREAVRHYMGLSRFETAQRAMARKAKQKGIKRADVEDVIAQVRKRQ